MGVSLFQPTFNASAVPVALPPFSPPDIFNCDAYYSYPSPPLLSDCRIAFRDLPRGNVPTAWYTEPAAGEPRNVLPLIVHRGTCQIIFHTSGQSAESVDPTWIVPNDIKTMATWVLAHCGISGRGGMITKGLKNTIDQLTNAGEQMFPDPPLPPSSSFYSLHIWNYRASGDIDWNPGNNDLDVGSVLDEKLNEAIQAAPAGSPAETELLRRWDWLWAAVGRMEYGEASTDWWDGPSHGLSSGASQLALNRAVGAANLSHGCYPIGCDGDSTEA